MRVIGLDIHRTFAEVMFLESGELIHGGRVELTHDAFSAFCAVAGAAMAAAVSLSPSRLTHLFIPAVGVPPRRRRLWLRLRDAVREFAGGASVTDAAHAAGFADAPHLNRTFRRMLGFTPHAAISMFVQDAQP